jgi:hypothetical protein
MKNKKGLLFGSFLLGGISISGYLIAQKYKKTRFSNKMSLMITKGTSHSDDITKDVLSELFRSKDVLKLWESIESSRERPLTVGRNGSQEDIIYYNESIDKSVVRILADLIRMETNMKIDEVLDICVKNCIGKYRSYIITKYYEYRSLIKHYNICKKAFENGIWEKNKNIALKYTNFGEFFKDKENSHGDFDTLWDIKMRSSKPLKTRQILLSNNRSSLLNLSDNTQEILNTLFQYEFAKTIWEEIEIYYSENIKLEKTDDFNEEIFNDRLTTSLENGHLTTIRYKDKGLYKNVGYVLSVLLKIVNYREFKKVDKLCQNNDFDSELFSILNEYLIYKNMREHYEHVENCVNKEYWEDKAHIFNEIVSFYSNFSNYIVVIYSHQEESLNDLPIINIVPSVEERFINGVYIEHTLSDNVIPTIDESSNSIMPTIDESSNSIISSYIHNDD